MRACYPSSKLLFSPAAGFTANAHLICSAKSATHLPEELQLIQNLKSGNAAAFNELVSAYSDRVYNTVLGMLQQAEDAEDVTQEVFVSVYRNIGKFRGDARLSTWVYRIAVTKSLEALRKRKRLPPDTARVSDEALKGLPGATFHHPGLLAENREKGAILFKALNAIPESQKTAFVLHKTEGLSYAEIAGVMEISLSSVESLIYRARQNLQKQLASFYRTSRS